MMRQPNRRSAGAVDRAGRTALIALFAVSAGCAARIQEIPPPRPIVIHSGARLRADHEEMKTVYEWVMNEDNQIAEDPSFWLTVEPVAQETYVWEGLRISEAADSVFTNLDRTASDAQLAHSIYAHLHLMVEKGRQEEWLPEAPDAVDFDLERAILSRVADTWLLGRTVFDTSPYGPLDELVYAKQGGFFDAFIFTARPAEFATARTEWARENPDAMSQYRDWFLETFNREPPGLRTR